MPAVSCPPHPDRDLRHRVGPSAGAPDRDDPTRANCVLPAGRVVGAQDARRSRHGRGEARRRDRSSRKRTRPTGHATSPTQEQDLRHRCSVPSPRAAPAPTASSSTTATSSREFGDTNSVEPTYSVAKSMLATVAGIAVRDGLITNLDAPVGVAVKDGGYDSPHNAQVTWRNHLQQESEWEGEMWGKKHDFVGTEAFGDGERKPRDAAGARHVLRIQRRAHQPLRAVAAAPVQEAGARRVPRRSHGPDRRVEHLAVDSVPQQLRRHRRQEDGVGERRHALGRRHVDQRLGHGALRLPVAARRQVGRRSRSCRRTT